MSLGSPRRTMRFSEDLIARIDAAILSANCRRVQAPYDWTGWVLQAVREKLRSLERGRASSRRKARKQPQPITANLEQRHGDSDCLPGVSFGL